MMSDRLPCCVPFCRRTTKAGRFTDWICAKHWPLVSLETRGAYNLAKRRARRIIARRPIYCEYWKLPAGSPERLRAVRMWRRIDAAWARCKCEAIERAAGI